jgi:hypothetical protein
MQGMHTAHCTALCSKEEVPFVALVLEAAAEHLLER